MPSSSSSAGPFVATTLWVGNAQATAQVNTITITAVATGGTVSCTINGKVVSYTCTGSDTTTSAAAALQALLAASTYGEFKEITWTNPSAGVVTATMGTAGVTFILSVAFSGGTTGAQVLTTPNAGPSDVSLPANWLRFPTPGSLGVPGIPQNGDAVIVANSAIPLLYNLQALANVQFASYTRWQSFTAQIGLPVVNPNGYNEYRQTNFQFIGPGPAINVNLGVGAGTGPTRERYDFQGQQVNLNVQASGSPADATAVYVLGQNPANAVTVIGTSLGIATGPTDISQINTATAGTGGLLILGSGVSVQGSITITGGTASLYCSANAITVNGSQLTVNGTGLSCSSITAINGANVTWLSNNSLTTLNLNSSSNFDASQDVRPMTLGTLVTDCTGQFNDPFNRVAITNPVQCTNGITSGFLIFGPGRTLKVV
jgi:hypothetical protein